LTSLDKASSNKRFLTNVEALMEYLHAIMAEKNIKALVCVVEK
jgi:hypothetical protein